MGSLLVYPFEQTLTVLSAPHLTAFFISFLGSVAVTPLVRAWAKRSRFVAHPVVDRWHTRPVPLLGGSAIVAAFLCGIAAWSMEPSLTPLLVCCGLMFVLGVADDVHAIAPGTKLVGQMVIAGIVVSMAGPISITGWPVIDQLLAFTWIIGITNAFNLLDNMDGLAAGVAALAGLCYLTLLLPAGGSPLTLGIAAFVGAVSGSWSTTTRPRRSSWATAAATSSDPFSRAPVCSRHPG